MKLILTLLPIILLSQPTPLKADIIGDKALYQVSRSMERTSSMIAGGTFLAAIHQFIPENEQGPSYAINYDYLLRIRFKGTEVGNDSIDLLEVFLNGTFLDQLRTEKKLVTPQFTAEHLGYEDIEMVDGRKFQHCDKIKLTHIHLTRSSRNSKMNPVNHTNSALTSLRDVEAIGYLTEQIPIIGVAQINITGILNDVAFRIGYDHVAEDSTLSRKAAIVGIGSQHLQTQEIHQKRQEAE